VTYTSTNTETVNYTIKPGSKVEIDGDTFEIRNLTGSTVTLYNREDFPGNYSIDVTINLKR
jgi:hypothetical protein